MEQSSELKTLMLQAYKALAKGDLSFFERYVSQADSMLAIGTDPTEWWAGKATFIKVLKAQLEEAGGFALSANGLQAYSEGSAGWAADHPKMRLPDGTDIPLRLTMVFLKENNDWRIVQWHISAGVSNEDVVGKALTTQ
jgi:hypothetical protein